MSSCIISSLHARRAGWEVYSSSTCWCEKWQLPNWQLLTSASGVQPAAEGSYHSGADNITIYSLGEEEIHNSRSWLNKRTCFAYNYNNYRTSSLWEASKIREYCAPFECYIYTSADIIRLIISYRFWTSRNNPSQQLRTDLFVSLPFLMLYTMEIQLLYCQMYEPGHVYIL